MKVEHLSVVCLTSGPVSAAATILAIVCNDDVLKHVVMERQCHLIEGAYIFVQCRNGEYVRMLSEVRGQR